jgi:polar amino acid transport system substrate-binding protein
MNIKKSNLIGILMVVVILLTACGSNGAPATAEDKLAEVKARGTLVIATDANYPPFSLLDKTQPRPADTKCTADQYTANQFSGFDAGTAIEIARRLGVEPCFVTPDWGQITAGDWKDAWDISVGSMTVTNARTKVLYFAQPYFATPIHAFVHKDNTTYQTPEDLSGKKIGTCDGCTYDLYLKDALELPGPPIEFRIKNAQSIPYETEVPAIADLSLGDGVKLDAVITQRSTGTEKIKEGAPLRMISQPLFFAYAAPAFDKKSSQDPVSFVKEVTKTIQAMQNDGTLLKLAKGNIEADLIPLAADFYIGSLNQFPK